MLKMVLQYELGQIVLTRIEKLYIIFDLCAFIIKLEALLMLKWYYNMNLDK